MQNQQSTVIGMEASNPSQGKVLNNSRDSSHLENKRSFIRKVSYRKIMMSYDEIKR